jgi:glycosyltransferase involved in cell wall biosynthesis
MNLGPIQPSLTLIIPAFNEEALIEASLNELLRQVSSRYIKAEIIVVDDGSQDLTTQIVTQHQSRYPQIILLRNERNRGKGYSVRRAVLQSSGEIIVFMDADLPYDFESVQLIVDTINSGAQVAIGSRVLPESKLIDKTSLIRSLAGQVFSLLIRLFLFSGISDTQCGLKGFRNKEAQEIFSRITIERFGFDVELLYLARRLRYKIQPVPVKLVFSRRDSRVKLINDSIYMLFDLLRIRINDYQGKYSIDKRETVCPSSSSDKL